MFYFNFIRGYNILQYKIKLLKIFFHLHHDTTNNRNTAGSHIDHLPYNILCIKFSIIPTLWSHMASVRYPYTHD